MTRFLYRRNRRTTASRVFLVSLALVFLLSFTGVVQAAAPKNAEEPVESLVQAPAEAVPSPQEEAPAPHKEEVVEEPAPAAPPAEAPAEAPAAAPAAEAPAAEAPAAEAPAAEAPAAAPGAEAPAVQSLEESPGEESTPPPDAGGYVTVPGNPATPEGCFKIDKPSAGTHTYEFMHGETTVTVNVVITEMDYGPVMSWTSDFPICRVIVKGGPNANVYSYGDGAMSGTGLHAPLNEKNNKWYGISHITFCPCEEPGEDTWNKHFALTVDGTVTAAVDSYIVKYMLDGVETTTVLSGSNGSSYHADVTVPDDSVISGWVFYAVVDGVEIALTAPGGSETMTGDATNTATFTPGSITGIKYIDADRDSTMPVDPDDLLGDGWTITLDGPGLGNGITDMTNASGVYMFEGLLPGTYSVDEVLRAGFVRIMPLGAVDVTLTLEDMEGCAHFVNQPEVPEWNKHWALTVDGTVTADVDSYIVKYMLDGVATTTVLTGSNGSFHADVMVPDDAVITGWVFYAVVNGVEYALTAAGGSETITSDETNTATFTPGTISGIKYIDADRDSTMPVDPDDTVGAGWTITLAGPALGEGISAVTTASGAYEFTGLLPGTYSVNEVLKAGYIRVYPPGAAEVVLTFADMTGEQHFVNAPPVPGPDTWNKHFALTINGAVAADVDSYIVKYMLNGVATTTVLTGSSGSYHADITVANGAVISGWVFYAVIDGTQVALTAAGGTETITANATNTATFTPGTVTGVKYIDADRDSAAIGDPGDTLGAGWSIHLTGLGLGAGLRATTGANGAYTFTGLLPGVFMVDEVLQSGFVRVSPLAAAPVTLTLAQLTASVNFLNAPVVTPVSDMQIVKEANRTTAGTGDLITYQITYSNTGSTTINAFTIVDEYPEALVTVVDAGGATDDGSKLTWSMTTPLAPGASGFVTYSVRVNSGVAAGTSILNVASIPEFQRSDTATVTVVEEGFLPFTEVIERAVGGAAPFLPFTGVEMLLLLGAASMAAGTGIALRRYMKR